MNYPTVLRELIECFKKLPGIGEKSAERLALATMKLDDQILEIFSDSIKNVKKKIKRCQKCNHFSENEICDICLDDSRNHNVICVVEEPKNVILFEKLGTYRGLYHVLDGLISPIDGINPEDIKIQLLLDRIHQNHVQEIIFAVRPSIEGETTTLYISKLLEGENIIISKIAHGVPLGADMDYIDALTLEMALEDRKKISDA